MKGTRLTRTFGFFMPRAVVRTFAAAAAIAMLVAFAPFGPSGLVASGLGLIGLGGMIMDELTEFCDATALNTGGAASYLVGDVYDLGGAGRDAGHGQPIYLVIQVATTATSGGAATGQFHLASDAQAAIAVDGTATYHFSTKAIPVATLVAGYVIAVIPLPSNAPPYERFLGILQTTAVAAFTAGAIDAFLTTDAKYWKAYANAANS